MNTISRPTCTFNNLIRSRMVDVGINELSGITARSTSFCTLGGVSDIAISLKPSRHPFLSASRILSTVGGYGNETSITTSTSTVGATSITGNFEIFLIHGS